MVNIRHQDKYVELSQLNRMQLLQLQLELSEDIDEIEGQLEKAATKYNLTGESADPDWFWSAKRALAHKQRNVQAVNMALGRLPRGPRLQPGRPLSEYFIDVARERLAPDVFGEVFLLAKARQLSEKNDNHLPSET